MTPATEFAARRESFLETFYGQGNDLSRAALLKSPTRSAEVARRWEQLLRDESSAVVLPRRHQKRWAWYAIAFDARTFRELGEQLMAFTGPSYSSFRGTPCSLDPKDPVEASILRFSGHHAYRLTVAEGAERAEEFAEALAALLRVRMSSVARSPERVRSTGRIIRDFQMALATQQRDEAETCLQVLVAQNHLDALNLRFLEVQGAAELGEWERLTASPFFCDLVAVRRPLLVTRAMIRAIYRVHLAQFEASGDPGGAARRFAEAVFPQYAPLYRGRGHISDPDVLKSFMLLAAVATPPMPELRDELLAATDVPEVDAAYLRELAALVPQARPAAGGEGRPWIAVAREALLASDFDRAIGAAIQAPVSVERASILLHCAYELSSSRVAAAAVGAVQALDAGQRGELFHSRALRSFWKSVAGVAVEASDAAEVPCSWVEWLQRVGDPNWSDAKAQEVAESAPDQWDIADVAYDAESVARLTKSIEAVADSTSGPGLDRFRVALPHLVRHLEHDADFPRPVLRPVYDSLRMALTYACVPSSVGDLAVFVDLCQVALELGCTEREYVGIVEDAEQVWTRLGAPVTLRPMVDFLDLLYWYPCPASEVRSRLVTRVYGSVAPWVGLGRVVGETLRLLRQLSHEYGVAEMMPPAPDGEHEPSASGETDPLRSLTGVVAIHTLMLPAGTRAKDILLGRSPECQVVVNSDKVGTNELRELARSADIFVVATGCAKHAATTYITTHRPAGLPLLRPSGKGTSSILQVLADHASVAH